MSSVSSRLARVSKQSTLFAGTAAAATMGAQSAHADLIIRNVDGTATPGNTVGIDVNELIGLAPDGRDEFTFIVKESLPKLQPLDAIEKLETGIVTTRFRKMVEKPKLVELEIADKPIGKEPVLKIDKRGIFAEKKTGDAAPYATRFFEGDDVGTDVDNPAPSARLYDDFGADGAPKLKMDKLDNVARNLAVVEEEDFGPFAEVGDNGYIGLFVDVVEFTDDDFLRFNALEVQEIDREGELLEPDVMRFFGWAEIERGSLNVIRFAFQSTPNTPAPIPGRPPIDVPEPASLPLMALGAAGLFAMRRKMAA